MNGKTNNLSEIIGIIPARWGSSRFPGKPLEIVLGESIIHRTYHRAIQSKLLEEVVVATDDERIFEHVIGFGGKCIMTPVSCPNGTARASYVIEHHYPNAKIIVNMQGDEPFLNYNAVDAMILAMKEHPTAQMLTPVALAKPGDNISSNKTVKCVFNKDNKAIYFSRSPIPCIFKDRPDVPIYMHIGIYCFQRELLLKYPSLEPGIASISEDLEQLRILENGYDIYVKAIDYKSVCIDYPEDIKKAEEFLLCHSNACL